MTIEKAKYEYFLAKYKDLDPEELSEVAARGGDLIEEARNNRGRTTFVFIASRVKGYQGLSKSYIRADVISKNLTPLCV